MAGSGLLILGLAVMKEGSPRRRRSVWDGLTRLLRIAIGPEIPRATVALMSIVAIPIVAVLVRAIGSRTSVLKSVALLTILPGRKAPAVVSLAFGLVSRPVGERLWGVRRSGRLRLKSLLRLLKGNLPLRGRSETIRQRVKIAVIVQVILILAGRALLTVLRQRLGSVRGGNKPEVMLRVLQIVFRRDRVSARMSVSRELEVFFRHVMRVAAYFHVWSVDS